MYSETEIQDGQTGSFSHYPRLAQHADRKVAFAAVGESLGPSSSERHMPDKNTPHPATSGSHLKTGTGG
eukprot:9492829-Pyramimonas_sp.AAC.1